MDAASGLRRVPPAMLAMLALALALRLGVALFAADGPVCCDAEDYIRHAESITDGDGYPSSNMVVGGGPTVLRPPVYPYFLGAVFAVAGEGLRAARVAQAVAGTVAVGLLGLLAWQIYGSRRAAVAASALAAVYPALVFEAPALLSEAVFLPLEIAALCAAWQARATESRRGAWLAGTGVLVGLAMLTRQTGILLLLPVGVILLTAPGRPVAARLREVVAIGAVTLAVVAPWTVRNYVVTDELVLVGRQTGFQLAGIYNDEARLNPGAHALWAPANVNSRDADLFRQPDLDELDLDAELQERAVDYAKDHPGYVVEALARNSLRMLELDSSGRELGRLTLNLTPGQARLTRLGWFLVVPIGLAGWFTAARRRTSVWFWISPLVFFAAGAATAGFVRYRIPVDPFVLLLAAAAIAAALDRWAPPRDGAEPGPTALAGERAA